MQLRYYQKEATEALFSFYGEPRKLIKGVPERKNPLVCLPTGTGKSLIIADFLQRAFQMVPGTRAIMSTHVKTLIEQNAAKLQEAWPQAPLGIYSAGLNRAEFIQPIIFGGVQSMVGKFQKLGHRDFLIIDEAHLLGDDGSYLRLIAELQQINPYLKVIGLTATPYRLGMGKLTNGKIFTNIVYDLCNIDGFNRLIAEGYLCPLIPKRTQIEIDVSNVGMAKGDFIHSELEGAIKKQNIIVRALAELVAHGQDRKSWCIFATGIDDAEECNEMLNTHFGISSVVMHSKRTAKHNNEALAAWRKMEVRCAVSMGMLTTGVDHPALDLIGMLRPTMSTGLWVQVLGRGTRPYEGKRNCLVLDFAGNTRRLGPINDPVIPKLKGKMGGDAPVRICNACNCYNHASARACIVCGVEFQFESKLSATASNEELLRSDLPETGMFKVDRVIYVPHTSKAGNTGIKVAYYCGLRTFYEYVSVEGKRGNIFGRDWFRQRFDYKAEDFYINSGIALKNKGNIYVPETDKEVLQLVSRLRMPAQIRVWLNANPNPRVLMAEF